MKVVEQKHEILHGDTPTKHIERIARVCYKSEGKISEDGTSAIKLIGNLYRNGHLAMMEHHRLIFEMKRPAFKLLESIETPYIKLTNTNDRYVASASIRGILEMAEYSNADAHGILIHAIYMLRDNIISYFAHKYGCELFGMRTMPEKNGIWFNEIQNMRDSMSAEEWAVHGWMSVLFTTNRGVTHELVRHRQCSFAQESTRYCNYGGDDIVFIKPILESDESNSTWCMAMESAEKSYNDMIADKVSPQIARGVLPTDVKADIVLTANVQEWLHIFNLRSRGTTGKPHPQMHELITSLFVKCINDWYIKECDGELKIGGDWLHE